MIELLCRISIFIRVGILLHKVYCNLVTNILFHIIWMKCVHVQMFGNRKTVMFLIAQITFLIILIMCVNSWKLTIEHESDVTEFKINFGFVSRTVNASAMMNDPIEFVLNATVFFSLFFLLLQWLHVMCFVLFICLFYFNIKSNKYPFHCKCFLHILQASQERIDSAVNDYRAKNKELEEYLENPEAASRNKKRSSSSGKKKKHGRSASHSKLVWSEFVDTW